MKVNVQGTYLLTQTIMEKMMASGWGRIVLLSSGLAEDGMPGSALYSGMKSALYGMIREMYDGEGQTGSF